MKKILCIGEALIDMICTDKGKSLSDGDNFLKKAGGAPTNVAAAIAALGGEVELAAKVGVDPFGKHLVDVMQSFGVSTRWVFQDEVHFTTFAFVSLMENGERDFYFNRGADGQLNRDEVDSIDLGEFSIAHFGSATGFLPGHYRLPTKAWSRNHCNRISSSVSIPTTGIYYSSMINNLSLTSHGTSSTAAISSKSAMKKP
ncbi:MAG: hypothetical protein IPP73_10800 [Chitinophagaceae bacterium]|nr:hypothetical protein [Chitinophagaceae bacterium]